MRLAYGFLVLCHSFRVLVSGLHQPHRVNWETSLLPRTLEQNMVIALILLDPSLPMIYMELCPRHPLPKAHPTACSRLLCLSASWFSFSFLLPLPQGFCTCHLFSLMELFFTPLLADLGLSFLFPCLVKYLLLHHVPFFLHSSHLRFYLYLCDFIDIINTWLSH